MRIAIFVMGVFIFAVGIGTRAEAQNYPWCAQYSSRALGGATNCGFVSFEQCMATVSGIGGFWYETTHIDRFIIPTDRDADTSLVKDLGPSHPNLS